MALGRIGRLTPPKVLIDHRSRAKRATLRSDSTLQHSQSSRNTSRQNHLPLINAQVHNRIRANSTNSGLNERSSSSLKQILRKHESPNTVSAHKGGNGSFVVVFGGCVYWWLRGVLCVFVLVG